MRLLVDNCVPASVAEWLGQEGHEVLHASELGADPGDAALLRIAEERGLVVVTNDTDFGALIFRDRLPHAGLIRLPQWPGPRAIAVLGQIIADHAEDLQNAAIITASDQRVRVTRRTPPDIEP